MPTPDAQVNPNDLLRALDNQAATNPMYPGQRVQDVVRALAGGVGDWVSGPTDYVKALQAPPRTPGQWSEWDEEDQNQAAQRAQGWAAGTGLGMLGAASPFIPKGALGVGGGGVKIPKQTAVTSTELAPPFYSAVGQTIDTLPMNKAPAEQWAATLRNTPGIKKEELDWLGAPPEGVATKQQMQEWAQNSPQVKTVTRSGSGSDPDNYLSPRYANYQLPGGENYREMLLTLPQSTKNAPRLDQINEEIGQLSQEYANSQPQHVLRATGETSESLLNRANDLRSRMAALESERISLKNDDTGFRSRHWDEPNVLAHLRMNDRMVPDAQGTPRKTLFLEELQSDWHQKGRKEGYRTEDTTNDPRPELTRVSSALNAIDEQHPYTGEQPFQTYLRSLGEHQAGEYERLGRRQSELEEEVRRYNMGAEERSRVAARRVPDAPFKQSWPDLALKHAIRTAAEEGHDQIAWTPGDVQADRYDLSKQISKITYNAPGSKLATKYGTVLKAFDHNGQEVINKSVTPEELSDVIGKEPAGKLLDTKPKNDRHEISGLDLKVGGEGMKSFYDRELVNKANALAKKYGAKVAQQNMTHGGAGASGPFHVESPSNPNISGFFGTHDAAQAYIDSLGSSDLTITPHKGALPAGGPKVHVLPITPQLREAALRKGFPLFSAAGGGVGAYSAGKDTNNDALMRALAGITPK